MCEDFGDKVTYSNVNAKSGFVAVYGGESRCPSPEAACPGQSRGLSGRQHPPSGSDRQLPDRIVARADVSARVRQIGLAMPDVEASIKYDGSEVLKAGGSFMAAIASDESAEADTLVVRCELDDRELLLEDAPETYYVTDFYAKYPLVLVRLAEFTEDALRDLLSVSRRMALEKSRR